MSRYVIFLKRRYFRCVAVLLPFMLLFCHTEQAIGQDYTIAKLKLFPDRDEVLVKDVTIDSLGFIWFLTNGEIYRYDGYRSLDILRSIEDQRLTDDMPQRILADHRNRLWMAGNANLSYLDLKTWQVHAADANLLPPEQNRMVSWIRLLADSTVMVAYENGHLLLIDDDNWVPIDGLYQQSVAANNKISPSSATFWNGKYWVGTSAGTLLSIAPLQGYQTEHHEMPDAHGNIVSLIARPDELAVTVFPDDLYRFTPDGEWKIFLPEDFSIAENDYFVLGEGEQMHVYADTKWAYLLDSSFGVKQRLAMPLTNGFGPKHVCIRGDEAVLGAEEGVFVIYPKTKGLSQFIPPNESANKSSRGIHVYPDGAFFYSTYQGAGFVDADGTAWPFEQLRHAYVLHPINDNELFVGTEGGFLKIFDRKKRRVSDMDYTLAPETAAKHAFNLPTHVMSLAETDTDYLIGSASGLWQLDKKNRILRRFADVSGEPHSLDLHIRHIQLTAQGGLLLSTNIGLFEITQGDLVKRYPLSGNLGIYKSIAIGDTLWMATQGKGIVAIDTHGNVLQTIGTNEGLSNNLVYSLEHTHGTFVAGTADGLNLVKHGQVRRIGQAEGLSQSEFNSGASFWDATRQRVYVGGLMGYTILDMTQPWFGNHTLLESYITEIHTATRASGAKTADYTWPYRSEQTLVLQPGQSLTGLYIGTPGNHRANSEIRYSLNDGEQEPLELGQFISLIEPSPGNYRFQLETRNTAITGNTKTLTITKLPYFYETWWFYTLVLLAITSAIIGLFKYKEKIQRNEKKMRINIARDLHDEVGSSLTRIYFQADLLFSKHAGSLNDKSLQQIADTSKQALLTMSDMVWSIDSRFDTAKDLVIRMKDYLYKLHDELDVDYRFTVAGDEDALSVSQLIRQNLLLIFKEAITNAVKYGDGSEITIQLTFGPAVRLTIQNRYASRKGPVSGLQGGRGLENMQHRASRMGGTLSYTGEGGVFSLALIIP